jgi:hypothetical protein
MLSLFSPEKCKQRFHVKQGVYVRYTGGCNRRSNCKGFAHDSSFERELYALAVFCLSLTGRVCDLYLTICFQITSTHNQILRGSTPNQRQAIIDKIRARSEVVDQVQHTMGRVVWYLENELKR